MMAHDHNPYEPPQSQDLPKASERPPRTGFSFALLLELFVLLAVVMTLISLLAPLFR
jgi:hypothetical protein